METRYLVRKYIPSHDKANIYVDSFEHGLEILGKVQGDVSQRVEWLGNVDVYFYGTNDYIRILRDKDEK